MSEVMMQVMLRALLVAAAGSLIGLTGARGTIVRQAGTALPANVPFNTAVRAGDFIYLAGTLATDSRGTLIKGDIRLQTRQVLDNLAGILNGAGSGMSQAASVTVYLRNAAEFAAMNEVYRTYWPVDPPARTTIIASLVAPDALVEMSMVAVRSGAERRVVHPEGWVKGANPYSYGIRSGDTLFLAGLVSRNGRDNSPVAGDITAQTGTVLRNAGEILRAAGMTFADVVCSRVYLTGTATFEQMNAAYRPFFTVSPPARATVKAGLTAPQYLIEITLTAVKGTDRAVVTTPNADGSAGRVNPNLSSAVRVGPRLFLSGMLGATDGNTGDARAQTRETMARIGRTLAAAGFAWKDVVDGVVYLPALRDFAAMNDGYREFFTAGFPARATVESGLVNPDALVEIMMTAVRR